MCDWISHCVLPEQDRPPNYHTHGFVERFDHPDFQIVLPIDPKEAHIFFERLAARIEKGECFRPGQDITGLLPTFPVRLAIFQESSRFVLRLLFPDFHGRFPGEEGCEPPFCFQNEYH